MADWSSLPDDVVRLVMQHHWVVYRERENTLRKARAKMNRYLRLELRNWFIDAFDRMTHLDDEDPEYYFVLENTLINPSLVLREIQKQRESCRRRGVRFEFWWSRA